VNPNVYVGSATEVPDERWAFEAPVVPFSVDSYVVLLVEGKTAFSKSPLLLEAVVHLVPVSLLVRLDETFQQMRDCSLLLSCHSRDRQSGKLAFGAAEPDISFSRAVPRIISQYVAIVDFAVEFEIRHSSADQGFFPLLLIQSLVDLVRQKRFPGCPIFS